MQISLLIPLVHLNLIELDFQLESETLKLFKIFYFEEITLNFSEI